MAAFEVKLETFRLVVLGVGQDVFFEGYVAFYDFMRRVDWGGRWRRKFGYGNSCF
jgi:hypothetical protein